MVNLATDAEEVEGPDVLGFVALFVRFQLTMRISAVRYVSQTHRPITDDLLIQASSVVVGIDADNHAIRPKDSARSDVKSAATEGEAIDTLADFRRQLEER